MCRAPSRKTASSCIDQAYAILSDTLPAGYYAAVSPDVDAINVECYIHSEDDLPEPEPEEDEEDDGTADSDEDDAQGVIDRILNSLDERRVQSLKQTGEQHVAG